MLTTDFRFDLPHGIGTKLRRDLEEQLAICVAAVELIKAAWRVARPADYWGAGENIVHERSGLSAVEQARTGLGF